MEAFSAGQIVYNASDTTKVQSAKATDQKAENSQKVNLWGMEPGKGFEPPTYSLRMSRTTSCANLACLKNGVHYTKFDT